MLQIKQFKGQLKNDIKQISTKLGQQLQLKK